MATLIQPFHKKVCSLKLHQIDFNDMHFLCVFHNKLKTALLGATKALASELAKDNIQVNCVAPGLIKTNLSSVVSCLLRAIVIE